MKVLYDSQAFDMQTHGGVSRCFKELTTCLPAGVKPILGVIETENEYLTQLGYPHYGQLYEDFILPREFPMKGRLFDIYYNKIKHYHYGYNQNKLYNIELLKRGKFDVFHPTFFDDYFLQYLNGKPFVLTIHDMIPFVYQNLGVDNWKWQVQKISKLAPLASAIVAVSENTKKDVIKYLDIPENKIHVVYHGSEHITDIRRYESGIDIKNALKCQNYILYVGERRYYKNFNLFIDRVAPLLKSIKDLYVVCTGRDFDQQELQFLKSNGIDNRFIHYWVTDDDVFSQLYHYAICFVYPSEYEGFGIPILEAYKAGCPVMLTKCSCFPEIAGDCAFYFDLNNKDDFLNSFVKLYNMSKMKRDQFLLKQYKRVEMFSWNKSAKLLGDIYKSIV